MIVSNEDQTIFPIRLGQKVKVCLNDEDFFIIVQFGSGNTALLPVYCYQCGLHVVSEASPTKAISTAYKYRFNTYTRYSGYQIMGWKNKDILESLKKNIQFTPVNINIGNKNIFIYSIRISSYEKWCYAEKHQGQLQKFTGIQLFELDNPITKNLIQQHKIPKCTLNDWNNEDILQQLFNYHVKRRTIANVDWKFFFKTWNESENPVIELELSLCTIYPSGYEFSERELGAWKTMLHAIGATNITLWSQEESKYQLWTKSINGQVEKVAFAALYKREFLISIPKNMPNTTRAFWKCFEHALACNKKNSDEKRLIELELSLCTIYPSGYEFSERELGAWKTMLHAIGATNITLWSQEESKYQLWTKSINGQVEKVAFAALYKREFLISIPKNMPNTTRAFWKCFEHALACNKKNSDEKRRILSIIANEFTYKELEQNLNVGRNTILESRKHARNEGYGAPILVKPVINKQRFTPEMLKQIENFLNDKEFVNMSSYKTDIKTGKPILYLQDTKKTLWERFSEEYPNGIRRTSFMTCLEGVFGDIEVMISAHIMDNNLKKQLLRQSQELRRYIRRQYSKELEISLDGVAIYNSCISHCIRYAFGACNLDHPITCSKCENLFHFFDKLKDILSEQYSETLDEYKQKLIAWMAHHARKTYLNIHVRTNLEELDGEAVIIVDYKMKILPQSARETKAEFFGKRGWSLHSVLVYTKNIEQNQMNVQTFDHWSDDTRQDAWYTASSLHTVFETINPKPKWVTIMSDNGMHYHCTELMLIVGKWKEWYNIIPRKWVFLEAGEAKTAIDSHHTQISQAIKRYIKLGYDINSGDDIESAIKNMADKAKLGTITGISNYQEWTWPTDEENSRYIFARALPGIGEWKIWSTEKIEKIIKKRKIEKPNPIYSQPSKLNKLWTMPIVNKPVKRMTAEIKRLLKIMFHSGTTNPCQKLNAQQMHKELLRRAEIGEIEKNEIPKVTTISNWITVFSRKWKEAMALRTLEENMNSENL
ncbi:hypothetical protein Glove_335g14 [Diversispora epigaea]|uniref:Uncharacterized protein n=1 Tax=Diversispora epigaea TaxID=1348612 RepID=A0A397HHW4_9GLOM|nr:hypothetical protein Glove_335g14 [Diversispora epigaea]